MRVDSCRILSVSTAPILTNYANVVLGDHPGATAVWHVVALELDILALVQLFVVAEHDAVGYDCCDRGMGRGDFGVITPL